MAKSRRVFIFSGGKGASQQQIDELKQYVDDSMAGAGAVAGVPCQIQGIDDITGGHKVTFLWEDNNGTSHTSVMNVMDGADGADGTDGQDGSDGVSPTVAVTDITGGHKVTITDSLGDHEFNVMDGEDGDDGNDGVSPTVATEAITGGNKVTITDATGDHEFNVMDGATGQTGPAGPGVASGGTTGQVLKKSSGTDYDTEWADLPDSEIVFSGTMAQYEAVEDTIPVGSVVAITDSASNLASLRNVAIQSISLEFGRANNTSYYIARIPKYAVNGVRITPKVKLTTVDNNVGSSEADYVSTLDYAKRNGSIFTINAGLFKISGDYSPHGRTICDGVSKTDEDAGQEVSDVSAHEVYPLCIDINGDLSTPYDRDVPTATMIANGVKQSVTGWGTLIQNYQMTDSTVFDEQKHVGDYIRQGIGQYQNGDYFVLTCDGVKTGIDNEDGMTYAELAAICTSKGVKFFYSLDGGGSAETVIGDRQINLVYENTTGRVVPTVIEFVLEA